MQRVQSLGNGIDIPHLKRAFDRIVRDIPLDSELYGIALLVEAYKTLENTGSRIPGSCLKEIVQNVTSDHEKCKYANIVNYLSSKGFSGKIVLRRLQKLHAKKTTSPPHLRILFTALFAEAMTPIVEKYATRIIFEGIDLGERILSIIVHSEKWGADIALAYLNRIWISSCPLDRLPSLLDTTFEKYIEEGVESRLKSLYHEFVGYQKKHELLEKLKTMMPDFGVAMPSTKNCLGYLIPIKKNERQAGTLHLLKPQHYTLGRYDPREHRIICNLWTIFLGPLWKIILIHENVEALFSFTGIHRLFALTGKKRIPKIEKHGIGQLYHALKHLLTIKEAKQYLDWKPFVNIALGMIPFGQIPGIVWFQKLEESYPDIALRIATLRVCPETTIGSRDYIAELLNRALVTMDEKPCFSEKNIPDPVIFSLGRKLREELLANNSPERVRRAGISRCIVRWLTRSRANMPSQPDTKNFVKEIQSRSEFVRPYTPSQGYNKREILQVVDTLSNLSIIKQKDSMYELCLRDDDCCERFSSNV